MSRSLALRLTETFFRHRLLFLAPLLAVGVLGAATAGRGEDTYRSSGTLLVDGGTFLSSLAAAQGGNLNGQTPAGYFSQQVNGLLQTDSFVLTLAADAGLDPDDYGSTPLLIEELRRSTWSEAGGDNLLLVIAEHADPATAQRLSTALIDRFLESQVTAGVGARTAAQQFFTEVTERYQADVVAARSALDEYARENPDPVDPTVARPFTQQVIIDRLTAQIDVAETRLTAALAKEEEARLAAAQTESDIRQRLQVADAPALPREPEPVLIETVVTVALFVVLGAVLSVAAVVSVTALDRTVRHVTDLTDRVGAEVLAVLPRAR